MESEKYPEIITRTAQAHFVVMALLEDYSEFVEKQTGVASKEVIDRVLKKTGALIEEFKTRQQDS